MTDNELSLRIGGSHTSSPSPQYALLLPSNMDQQIESVQPSTDLKVYKKLIGNRDLFNEAAVDTAKHVYMFSKRSGSI